MAASVHGSESCSKWARTTLENSQVRMISWAWGRRSIGKRAGEQVGVVDPAAGDLRA